MNVIKIKGYPMKPRKMAAPKLKYVSGRMLPASLARYASRIADYSDERGSDNGIWVSYKAGWKSYTDPVGNLHSDHEDTVATLVVCARNAMPCDCDDCKLELEKTK